MVGSVRMGTVDDHILKVFNNTAAFEESHLTELLSNLLTPSAMAYYDQFESKEELLRAFLEAEWTEVRDISIATTGDHFGRCFRSNIPGLVRYLHITQVPTECKLTLQSRGLDSKCELVSTEIPVDCCRVAYSSLMTGEGSGVDQNEVIWTLTPGPIRPPKKYLPKTLHGFRITREEALKEGLFWVRVVKSVP